MDNFFENKACINKIEFCHSRKPTVDEREIHNYHEILFYIDGNATLICDEYSKPLSTGALIFIPAGKYHFFSTASPECFERFKITLPQSTVGERLSDTLPNSVSLAESLDPYLHKTLEKMLAALEKADTPSREALLFGSAFVLLSFFSEQKDRLATGNRDTLISKALLEIDRSLYDRTSLRALSLRLFVSPSTLSHAFKKEMGISLHRYVTQKRLIEAEKMISGGDEPTKVSHKLGYRDYSSFYKAYRAFFGFSPSESRERKLPKI